MADDVIAPSDATAAAKHPPTESGRSLSAPQLAILGAQAWLAEPAAYTVVAAIHVEGVPQWSGLADAARATLSRHDALTWQLGLDRDGAITVSGGPTVDDVFTVEDVDLSSESTVDAQALVTQRLQRERHRPVQLFDDADRPYTRMILFRYRGTAGDSQGVCALVTHHLLIDEYSTELIWSEMLRRAAGRNVPDQYDLRYADWARSTTDDVARVAARAAAERVLSRVGGAPIGIADGLPRATTAPESPVRFQIPPSLSAAVVGFARASQVPPAAVYAAALGQTLCEIAAVPGLVLSVPVTRRTELADIDTVGCYVNTVPVLARPASNAREAVAAWSRTFEFATAHAHAEPPILRKGMGGVPHVALMFESRGGTRLTRPIRWWPLPPPDSPAKAELTAFLSPGTQSTPGGGRLVWRQGYCDRSSAEAIVRDLCANLARLAGSADAVDLRGEP